MPRGNKTSKKSKSSSKKSSLKRSSSNGKVKSVTERKVEYR